eukprot:159553_1
MEQVEKSSVIKYCIPSFFVMIAGEVLIGYFSGNLKNLYRINDTINSISLGIVQQLFIRTMAPFLISIYTYVYQYHLFDIEYNYKSLLLATLLYDFLYYWAHRLGHEWNWMWAAHSIHHSSENYNLSTALRQASFQHVTWYWIQSIPVAFIGVPIEIFIFVQSVNIVSQFWIHTQYCKHLGFIENIINTPAQHIIHHSRAPGETNKNYAGMFSIWDRIFGTFDEGYRPKKFGIVEEPYTWDPIIINTRTWWLLFTRMFKYKTVTRKVRWLFSSARFTSQDVVKNKNLAKNIRYDPILTSSEGAYCVIIFFIVLFEYLYASLVIDKKGYRYQVLTSIYCILSTSSLAHFMDKSYLGKVTETVRWIIIVLSIYIMDYIGDYKVGFWFNDDRYNSASFLSANIGVVISKLPTCCNDGFFGRIVLLILGLYSIKIIWFSAKKNGQLKQD